MRTLTIDEIYEIDNILADAKKIRHSDPGAARVKIEAVRDFIVYFNSLGPIDFGDTTTGIIILLCHGIEHEGEKQLVTEKLADTERSQLQVLADANHKQINDLRERIRLSRPSRVYPSLKEARESLKTSPALVDQSFDMPPRSALIENKKAQTTFMPETNQYQSQGIKTQESPQDIHRITAQNANPTFLMRLWTAPLTKIALCLLMVSAVVFGLTGVGLIAEVGAIVAGTLLVTSVGLFAASAKLTTDTAKAPSSAISI